MKIGIIFPKDSVATFDTTSKKTFGGASVQMYAMAEELVRTNQHNVFCVIPKLKNLPTENDYRKWNLHEVFDKKKSVLHTVFSFHKIIRQEKPEVLIQHGLTLFSCLLAVYCKLYKIKFVFMFASDQEIYGRYQVTNKKCLLFKLLTKYTDVLVVQNIYQQEILKERYGIKGVLVYVGFPEREPFSGIKDIILWIGRCDKAKQPEIFIKLAKSIPGQKFVMICPAIDSGYFSKVKEIAGEVQNLEFVDFVPFQETWNYFDRAKLFVNTSTFEGFPQTFVQAVSCRVPIASLTVDPDSFITKEQCGVVCEGDENKLFSVIQSLLKDNQLLSTLSKSSAKYGTEKHSISLNVSRLISKISYD
jgi:glycosyltransferase involved in cell wall biosynthesis